MSFLSSIVHNVRTVNALEIVRFARLECLQCLHKTAQKTPRFAAAINNRRGPDALTIAKQSVGEERDNTANNADDECPGD